MCYGGTEVEFQAFISTILSSACLLTLGHNTITGHWSTYTEVTVSNTVVWVIFGSAQIFLPGQERDFCYWRHCHIHVFWEHPHALNIRSVNQKRVFPTPNLFVEPSVGWGGSDNERGNTLGQCSFTSLILNCSGHVQASACSTFFNTAKARRKAHSNFYINAFLETALSPTPPQAH